MMAWVRTAISLITFGFSIYKFFQIEQAVGVRDKHLIGPREFALLMVGAGLVSLVIGTFEHWQNLRLLGTEYPDMPRSRVFVLGLLVSALGVLAFIAVIFRQ
jgi:putative membrane protein